jgi:glycosyltransferase involved in cell wall biosynthesis
MRVLHVIPAVAPRYGGPSQAVVGMAKALRSAQADVLIATTDADGSARLPLLLEARTDWQGVPAIFFRRQWSEAWKYSRPLARWLDAHVADADVVHIHAVFSHACVAAANSSRRRKIPYIVRPLGTLDPWSLRQKPVRKQLLWLTLGKRMLTHASAIHYTTTSEQHLAEGPLGLSRGFVLPLGVDDAILDSPVVSSAGFRERVPGLGEHPYVLTLGRLHPKKRLDLLCDAFIEATNTPERRHWRLVVAGDGEAEYVNALKASIQARGGDDRVIFSGWLGGAAKLAALQNASLLALTSRQENFGLVVAEAMACGVPVLVSEHVNLADEIFKAKTGWVVRLERSDLVAGLAEAIDDETLRRACGKRAFDFARTQFRWSHIAAALLNVYAAVGA